MNAAGPKDRAPEEAFIEHLRQELDVQIYGTDPSRVRSVGSVRARLVLGAAAVLGTLGGALVTTTSMEHALVTAPITKHSYIPPLRMGTFESKDGHAIGGIVAYRGDPSWLLMDIRVPNLSGTLRCQIETDNGQIEVAGTFAVQNGVGDWARPIPVDIDRIRGATLVTSQGSALATASFTGS
jgi:hypothetical protein